MRASRWIKRGTMCRRFQVRFSMKGFPAPDTDSESNGSESNGSERTGGEGNSSNLSRDGANARPPGSASGLEATCA
jgi:hypothetical protein